MGKIGTYEYPDFKLATMLKSIDVLIQKFNGQVKDEKTFAEALGHSTNKSGGFLMKLADLRRYGFIDKRGGINATNRAKHIVNPLNDAEKRKELSDAVIEIKLWKDLYQRLKTKSPSAEDFKLQLVELTSDRDKAVSVSETIRNLYIDAMANYTEDIEKGVIKSSNQTEVITEQANQSKSFIPKGPNMIETKSGDVYITLPKDHKSIEIARKLLDVLSLQIDDKETNL